MGGSYRGDNEGRKTMNLGYFLVVFMFQGKLHEEAYLTDQEDEARKRAESMKGYLVKALWIKRYDKE